jgi:hypothetical protein
MAVRLHEASHAVYDKKLVHRRSFDAESRSVDVETRYFHDFCGLGRRGFGLERTLRRHSRRSRCADPGPVAGKNFGDGARPFAGQPSGRRSPIAVPAAWMTTTACQSAFAISHNRGSSIAPDAHVSNVKQPNRHCERSEAIHRATRKNGLLGRGACHRARIRATRWLLAMTASHNFAISRPDMPEVCWKFPQPSQSEGAGNAGRSMHPQPRVQNKKAHEHSHHGHTGFTRHSPRNGFNGLWRALPGVRGRPHHPIGCQPIDCSVMRSHVRLRLPSNCRIFRAFETVGPWQWLGAGPAVFTNSNLRP